jgi:rRNA-processing protein FCF1
MFKKSVPKTVPSAIEIKRIREKEREERIVQLEEEEMERLENAEHPNMHLTMEDILHFGFDENVLERALEKVNVMILTRLIRERYPHKFE